MLFWPKEDVFSWEYFSRSRTEIGLVDAAVDAGLPVALVGQGVVHEAGLTRVPVRGAPRTREVHGARVRVREVSTERWTHEAAA